MLCGKKAGGVTPDCARPMPDFTKAVAAVEAWLTTLGPPFETLPTELLGVLYPERGFAAGWRLPFVFPDQARRLDLLIPIGFPWQPPRVALVDAPAFLTWPHVEKDNLLCLAPNTFEINPDEPVGAAAYLVIEAERAVNDLVSGKCDSDFSDEFLSYWDWASHPGSRIISLLRPEPPTRTVVLWQGKTFYVIGETADELRNWLTNRFGKPPQDFETMPAVLTWLGEAPKPSDYPATGSSLRSFLTERDQEATALVGELARAIPNRIMAVLGFTTANGPALAGVLVSGPNKEKYGARDPVAKGFRPGKVPDSILLARYLGGQPVTRRTIERADAGWVHGRGQDGRAQRLRGQNVVVFGCGSLGAPLAVSLAQSGVGRMTLVDPERLAWANVGRHPLGGSHVDQGKARGLAEKLRLDFPHGQFDFLAVDVDTCVRKHAEVLANADLIIAATGSWAADSRLDAWHASVRRKIPVLYTWMEAHAIAGHALLLVGEAAELRSGFDGTGLPNFRVTDWPTGQQVRQEPACGAVYQPYGPLELGFVCNLSGELALDALLGETKAPVYRIWIGVAKRLQELGGVWTPAWQADPQFREAGGCIAERAWKSSAQAQAA